MIHEWYWRGHPGKQYTTLGNAESIILSANSAESMMLSACAKSIILSAPPAEIMMLSAWGHACALMLREYHTLNRWRWEYDDLSMRWEYHTLGAACWEYDALSVRARLRSVKCALVGERIRGWYSTLKVRYRSWVYCFENEVLKVSYNSVWLMFDHWRYILLTLPQSFSQKEN